MIIISGQWVALCSFHCPLPARWCLSGDGGGIDEDGDDDDNEENGEDGDVW